MEKNTNSQSTIQPVENYAIERAKQNIRDKIITGLGKDFTIEKARKVLGENFDIELRIPPPNIEGHLSFPCFPLAKILRKSPMIIAKELADTIPIEKDGYIDHLKEVKGFLNIFLNRERFNREIFMDFEKYGDDYGNSMEGKGKTVVIDLSSPNVAKPFSVGNVRSTTIGDSISRIYKALGWNVINDNHLGDWGTQFGKLLYAYEVWGDNEKIGKDPINELLKLYVRFHNEMEGKGSDDGESENPMLTEARKRFKLLEDKDPEMTRIWSWFVDLSMREFNKIYDRLDVKFDYNFGESFYSDKTDEVIDLLEESGIATREEDGSLVVPLDKEGISTPALIQKKDGATLYATRELATIIYRIRRFQPDLIIYVVGSEQKLHFNQCFKVMEMLGFKTRCAHVDFGLVSLKEGKMSARKGRVVFFDRVMAEGFQKALEILKEKRPDLPEEEKIEIARVVSVGAIKFNDLAQNRVKNVVFDWDNMLSFEGDTAPYLQYSYARVQSILRKADVEIEIYPELLKENEEFDLIRKLSRFPETIKEAGNNFAPHIIAQYLLEIARAFSVFYGKIPVLKAPGKKLMMSRLALIRAYADVIKRSLSLLGIDTLSRM
ncbi:MAG: arginine--tRNA ligase [Candidatus Eremiobacteraeota bacterium]|nr:arginine--tRNA ligase [Candidatus Eremiobacteraeota bacterium]